MTRFANQRQRRLAEKQLEAMREPVTQAREEIGWGLDGGEVKVRPRIGTLEMGTTWHTLIEFKGLADFIDRQAEEWKSSYRKIWFDEMPVWIGWDLGREVEFAEPEDPTKWAIRGLWPREPPAEVPELIDWPKVKTSQALPMPQAWTEAWTAPRDVRMDNTLEQPHYTKLNKRSIK